MGNTYDFLKRKGNKITWTNFWTPTFNGSIFDPNSYPKNRKNSTFEIRGMTIGEGTIENSFGTFVLKNGVVAVFNNASALIEIIGDADGAPGNGLSVIPWKPEIVTTGTDVYFTEQMMGTTDTRSNSNHTFSTGADDSNVWKTNIILPVPNTNNTHYGFPFYLSAPADTIGIQNYVYAVLGGGAPAGPFLETTLSVILIGEPVNSVPTWRFYAIGNIDSDYMELASQDQIPLTWSENTQYTISYDPTAGTYGTIRFWVDTTLIYSYPLTMAKIIDPNRFAAFAGTGGNGSCSFTIANQPAVAIPGVTFITGNSELVYPENIDNAIIEIVDLIDPFDIEGFGIVDNGDIILTNSDSELVGRVYTPDEMDALLSTPDWTPLSAPNLINMYFNTISNNSPTHQVSTYGNNKFISISTVGFSDISPSKYVSVVASNTVFNLISNTINAASFKLSNFTGNLDITTIQFELNGTGGYNSMAEITYNLAQNRFELTKIGLAYGYENVNFPLADFSINNIYTLGYNLDGGGTYGTVYFYENNTLIASSQLNSYPPSSTDSVRVYSNVNHESTLNIELLDDNFPTLSGVTFYTPRDGISESYSSSIPTSKRNKLVNIVGLAESNVAIPNSALTVSNNDVVFINKDGEVKYKLHNP